MFALSVPAGGRVRHFSSAGVDGLGWRWVKVGWVLSCFFSRGGASVSVFPSGVAAASFPNPLPPTLHTLPSVSSLRRIPGPLLSLFPSTSLSLSPSLCLCLSVVSLICLSHLPPPPPLPSSLFPAPLLSHCLSQSLSVLGCVCKKKKKKRKKREDKSTKLSLSLPVCVESA